MKNKTSLHRLFTYCTLGILFTLSLAGCIGRDVEPVYFEPPGDDSTSPSSPSVSTGAVECTVSFESQLCVMIKGEGIEAGTDESDPLCVDVDPFPIHISGTEVSVSGSEFPDVLVEGHGLPAPITINARGDGNGSGNIGTGSIDAEGNITIEDFSFFIVALGMVGEIPSLTLTTGSTEELPHLPAISGSPPDASGAMTLVIGTVLGHMFEAADKILMGASLQATMAGSITPTLAECANSGGPRSIEITKLIIDDSGAQTDAQLPDGKIMAISSGTYIASGPSDVGPRFESSAKFRVKNIGARTVQVSIPPRIGAFTITSTDSLTQQLSTQRSFTITVSFHPTTNDTQPGLVEESLVIGTDLFVLQAEAITSSGSASIDTVDESGDTERPQVDEVDVGNSSVPTSARRGYFTCDPIECEGGSQWTNCIPCEDQSSGTCILLAITTDGKPLAEMDNACKPAHPDATPLLAIDLWGSASAEISARKQVIAVRNSGVSDLNITEIKLEDAPDTQSKGEFHLSKDAIFVADSFDSIKYLVDRAIDGQATQGAEFPILLPPYQPGVQDKSVFLVITYQPKDLIGSDGTPAGVGSDVKDKAILTIVTSDTSITTEVTGSTSIRDVPPLELYFKTSTGLKSVEEGDPFSFRSITADTVDSAAPLFLKLADSATSAMRITSIELTGGDIETFEWLNTKDKISSKNPPSGQGMRCSIPIIDDTTGQMTGEIFDLEPVPLGSGYDLMPGAYSTDTMPLFGCINFHRDTDSDAKKRLFDATLTVSAYTLDATNNPVRNPDGSFQESKFPIRLLAAINPRTGTLIFRVVQTMSIILNPQFPGNSAIASREEMLKLGGDKLTDTDLQVFLGAFMLDPFDEETIYDSSGSEILSTPGDGITGVFRALNSVLVNTDYEDPFLYDYASLLHDSSLPPGEQGIFEGFPNTPEGLKSNSWRIYTAMLSYPGPLAPLSERPEFPSQCEVINPCDPEGLKKFTDAGVPPGEKGACTFFYAEGGRYDSPALHTEEEMPGGELQPMCNIVGRKPNMIDMNTGFYELDGSLNFEEVGLRFFGPTYFHNPGGPLGPVPPMDVIFHTAFTTDALKPQTNPDDPNVIPDERIDIEHNEFKINLDDPTQMNPPMCSQGVANRVIDGKTLSTWTYMAPLLSKDEDGKIPAGCPQPGINDFTGGSAYLHGRKLDHETGIVTVVAATKFGPSNDLTFAFKDVMMFLVLNGWICDPLGNEEMFEGSRCYDIQINDRDAESQISMTEG